MGRIYPLFSSSKGNSTYIGNKQTGILIDAGISYTRLVKALALNEIDISAVKAVFVTHDHSDHINGIKMLSKKTSIPVFAQKCTLESLYDKNYITGFAEEMKCPVCIDNMEISCFNTPHDTEQSCGYRINFDDGKSCAVCTDLGYVTDDVYQNLLGANAVLIESNYDEVMLRNGPYPAYLKSRIRSKFGHLSNADCGEFCTELVKNGTTRLILGHLSQENNTPQTARKTVAEKLSAQFEDGSDYLLSVAPVETIGGFISF